MGLYYKRLLPMALILNLPAELLNIISTSYNTEEQYYSKYVCNMRLVCRQFYKAINLMTIKIHRFNQVLFSIKNKRCLATEFALCKNNRDYCEYYRNIIKYCVNNNCKRDSAFTEGSLYIKGLIINQRQNYMLGMTYFYYPQELMEEHDYINDPYGTNFEYPHRLRQCLNGPYIKQVMPYCTSCMHKFCYIEKRSDRLATPFGDDYSIQGLEIPNH